MRISKELVSKGQWFDHFLDRDVLFNIVLYKSDGSQLVRVRYRKYQQSEYDADVKFLRMYFLNTFNTEDVK